MEILVIDHTELTGGHALQILGRTNEIIRRMAHLEGNFGREGWRSQEMEILDRKLHAMCLDGFVAFHHIENILFHVFLHHIPGTASEAKSLALADSVEPMALMLTKHLTGFDINDIAFLLGRT